MLVDVYLAAGDGTVEQCLRAFDVFAGRVFTLTHAAGVLVLTLIQTLVVAYEVGRRAGHKHDECTGGEQEALQVGKDDTKHERKAGGFTRRQVRYKTRTESRRPYKTASTIQNTNGKQDALKDVLRAGGPTTR